jgi:phosphoserine phosphatase RsbU/P
MRLPFKRLVSEAPSMGPTVADLPSLGGADVAGLVRGQRVGGDFYQFARASPQRVVFGLLDVAGSAAENRRIVEAARQTFSEAAPKFLGCDELNEADAMMEFCQALNTVIMRAANGVRQCAAFLGCYNEELGTVCYVNAGHTPGLLRYDSEVSELSATGMPLGLFSASTYEAPTAAVPVGGGLLLVSRGVVEASRRKEEYGLQRVKEQFSQTALTSAHDVAASALEAVRQFDEKAAERNDLTTLVVLRHPTIG